MRHLRVLAGTLAVALGWLTSPKAALAQAAQPPATTSGETISGRKAESAGPVGGTTQPTAAAASAPSAPSAPEAPPAADSVQEPLASERASDSSAVDALPAGDTPASSLATEGKEALRAALSSWAKEQFPPCQVRAFAQDGETHLLACGNAGLWRVHRDETTRAFVLESREQRGGNVVGFAKFGGEVLVLVDLRVLQPLDGGTKVLTGNVTFVDKGKTGGAAGEVGAAGRVLSTRGIRVKAELSPHHQLSVGYRVAFKWEDHYVVGRVVRVGPTYAEILLGLQEPAPPYGTPVVQTPEPSTARMMAPRDGDYHYSFDLGVRIGASADGIFGAEGGIRARYGLLALSGEVRPFVFSTTGIMALQAFVSVGVTNAWFALTFGAGSSTVNQHDSNPPGTGILMTPALRIGTIDGFNLRSRLGMTLHRQSMHFSALFVEAQVPVSRAIALVLAAGGGHLGVSEAEAGVRGLIFGNGGKGSWFLKGLGGLTVLNQNGVPSTANAPHLRVTMETRL